MLATVASVNSANRLQHRLKQDYTIQTKIIQTPSTLAREGCGYSLKFDDLNQSIVKRTAAELRINIRAFYREEINNGKPVYIKV